MGVYREEWGWEMCLCYLKMAYSQMNPELSQIPFEGADYSSFLLSWGTEHLCTVVAKITPDAIECQVRGADSVRRQGELMEVPPVLYLYNTQRRAFCRRVGHFRVSCLESAEDV